MMMMGVGESTLSDTLDYKEKEEENCLYYLA